MYESLLQLGCGTLSSMVSVSKYLIHHRPNVITVSGFALNVIYFLVTLYYTGFSGSTNIPSWACYFSAFAYCLYITLDNMDGKQARRTKSSSPLGLLVDHGTDATTTFWITMGLGSILYFSDGISYTYLWLMITFPFFLNTWEEYHTGELYLPIIHGVSEGMLLIAAAECISGYYGPSFWFQKFNIMGYEIQYNIALALFGFTGGMFFGLMSIVKVCRFLGNRFLVGLKDCVIYVLLVSSYLLVLLKSDSTIAKDYPKILILTYGFCFARLMTMLQLSHLMSAPYNPYTLSFLIPIMTNLIHTIFYIYTGKAFLCSIDVLISIFLVWNFGMWCHCAYNVSEEMCNILNINRFSIGKRIKDQ